MTETDRKLLAEYLYHAQKCAVLARHALDTRDSTNVVLDNIIDSQTHMIAALLLMLMAGKGQGSDET